MLTGIPCSSPLRRRRVFHAFSVESRGGMQAAECRQHLFSHRLCVYIGISCPNPSPQTREPVHYSRFIREQPHGPQPHLRPSGQLGEVRGSCGGLQLQRGSEEGLGKLWETT